MKSAINFGFGFGLAVAVCFAGSLAVAGIASASTLSAPDGGKYGETVSFSVASPRRVYSTLLKINKKYRSWVTFQTKCIGENVEGVGHEIHVKTRSAQVLADIANSCPGGQLTINAIPLP